jgi:hypothetical protein
VSEDPEAKNSPKGWKSRDAQLDLCPVKVRTTFASSTSHIFIVPLDAPAPIIASDESKLTDSTGLVRPDRLKMELGFPMAQRLTFWSSPPVMRILDVFLPNLTQLTSEACATNSSGHCQGNMVGCCRLPFGIWAIFSVASENHFFGRVFQNIHFNKVTQFTDITMLFGLNHVHFSECIIHDISPSKFLKKRATHNKYLKILY